jgi:hypothetical protein
MNTQMQKSKKTLVLIIGFLLGGLPFYPVLAQETFVHPGGLHTLEDLVRMKTQVAAKVHPWIDAWEQLIKDPLAQHTYQAKPVRDMNNRQLLNKDAHAAYLNAIRWFISGMSGTPPVLWVSSTRMLRWLTRFLQRENGYCWFGGHRDFRHGHGG